MQSRISTVYPNRTHCNYVVSVLALSRNYGVHKAHATAVAACTHRKHKTSSCTLANTERTRLYKANTCMSCTLHTIDEATNELL